MAHKNSRHFTTPAYFYRLTISRGIQAYFYGPGSRDAPWGVRDPVFRPGRLIRDISFDDLDKLRVAGGIKDTLSEWLEHNFGVSR